MLIKTSVFYLSDKENLDRSSDVSMSGFDSPAGKLVSVTQLSVVYEQFSFLHSSTDVDPQQQ